MILRYLKFLIIIFTYSIEDVKGIIGIVLFFYRYINYHFLKLFQTDPQILCPRYVNHNQSFTCILSYIDSISNSFINVDFGDETNYYYDLIDSRYFNYLNNFFDYFDLLINIDSKSKIEIKSSFYLPNAQNYGILMASKEFLYDSLIDGFEIYSEEIQSIKIYVKKIFFNVFYFSLIF
jgi:hypothetical protein